MLNTVVCYILRDTFKSSPSGNLLFTNPVVSLEAPRFQREIFFLTFFNLENNTPTP